METTEGIDRLAIRSKPPGVPVMHQTWQDLLFLHWPIDPAALRPLIPAALDIDTFEDQAWIGITPFSLSDLRITAMPAIPGLSSFDEINVRTYVVHNGTPGIWFFSLDASKLIPAMAARLFFMLPYHRASIEFARDGEYSFTSQRTTPPPAQFHVRWRVGLRLRAPDLESLAFFLVERYCYFAVQDNQIYETRIYHVPWILEEAILIAQSSNIIQAVGLTEPSTEPLVHFSRRLNVDIWTPQPV